MAARKAVVLVLGELQELSPNDNIMAALWVSSTLNLPSGAGVFEFSASFVAVGILPSAVINIKLAPALDSDENDPELLTPECLIATPRIDSFEVFASFRELTSGPVQIQYQIFN